VTVMHAARIELSGFHADAVPGLKAMGLLSEIIAYRLRLFIPMGEDGPCILGGLLERYPPAAAANLPN